MSTMQSDHGLQLAVCCPVCRSQLRIARERCECTSAACGASYPRLRGIPVLIDEASSVFTIEGVLNEEPTFFKPRVKLRRRISACLPSTSHNLSGNRVVSAIRRRLHDLARPSRVLVVGGGDDGPGMEILRDDPGIEIVETDVMLCERTSVICDCHSLPFEDDSFDAVVAQAVLQHVLDAHRCVDEMHRVLRPGGLVYADTPFMQQVHGRELDFTRYSLVGCRRLFQRFREIDAGLSGGPGMALAWSLRYFCLSFFSGKRSRAVVSGLARCLFFWLRYFDYFLVHKESALDAAAAFYFVGEKIDEPITGGATIASYRGGF